MKSAALRHLLLDRARHTMTTGSKSNIDKLHYIVSSLTVEQTEASYKLAWTDSTGARSIHVPLGKFSFYVQGDSSNAIAHRPDIDFRSANWKTADEVLNTMAGSKTDDSDNTYGFALFTPKHAPKSFSSPFSLSLSIVAGLIIATGTGPRVGAAGFAATLLALILYRRTVLARYQPAPSWFEDLVISAGITLACFFGPPETLLFLLMAATAPCIAETVNIPVAWFVAGLVSGPAAAAGWPGAIAVTILVICSFASSWMMTDRLPLARSIMFAAGALAGGLALGNYITPAADAQDSGLTVIPALLLTSTFALWWFHGIQRQLFTWYSQLALAMAAYAAVNRPGWVALTGLSGIGLALGGRVVQNFRRSRREK